MAGSTAPRRLFGLRAALIAGVGLAVWPLLVLWSVTILRDTSVYMYGGIFCEGYRT